MRKTNPLKKIFKEIKLLKKIFNSLGNQNIFFVGGVVRNYILNEPLEDIDLAVKLNVKVVKKKLLKEKIQFTDISKGHGTISLLSQKKLIEITSMRIDKETYGRKAKVEFVNDIYLDSCRRDFTINSIYSNFNGEIYDPHNGIKDLKNRNVKFIGDPLKRIKEDNLRILRYYRFLSYYGCNAATIDKNSMKVTKKHFDLISNISKERKSYEFYKLILGAYAAEILLLIKKQDKFKYILPGLEKINNSDIKLFNDLKAEKLIRLSFLLIMSNFEIKRLRDYLFLTKKEFLRLELICINFKLFSIKNKKYARKAKFKLGVDVSMSIYYLKCFLKGEKTKDIIHNTLKYWNAPVFPISGNDLQSIGISKGKEIGITMKKIEDWWVLKDFKPNKNQCLSKSKSIVFNLL